VYSISLTDALRLTLVAALCGAGMVAISPATASAMEVACQRSFSKRIDGVGIPDNGALSDGIDVPEDGLVVTDLDVSVNVRHPSPTDLTIFLRSFADRSNVQRSSSVLFEDSGDEAGQANILGAIFDDGASTPIVSGGAPYAGRWIPAEALAAHNGLTGGGYLISARDDVTNGKVGTLDDWTITFTYQACDFDADGVEDHVDQCRDLTARTATGCPVVSRVISAKYRAGKVRGALSSPEAGCTAGRAVTVFRKRPGPDRRVGTATTRTDGSWQLRKPKKRGRYYATSAKAAVPERAECPAVTSRTFRIP
jgi:subtilisin-like proprotein convertase family protein